MLVSRQTSSNVVVGKDGNSLVSARAGWFSIMAVPLRRQKACVDSMRFFIRPKHGNNNKNHVYHEGV